MSKTIIIFRMIVDHELRISVPTIHGSTKRINSKITENIEKMLDKNWMQIDSVFNHETKKVDFFYMKRSRKNGR